jgi:general secretion pathway protein C
MRIVPALEAGAAVGFRIAWLAQDAVARRAGLEQGDVITAVNGHSLTDFEQTAALAKEVNTATRFTADIMRAGAPLRLEVKAL